MKNKDMLLLFGIGAIAYFFLFQKRKQEAKPITFEKNITKEKQEQEAKQNLEKNVKTAIHNITRNKTKGKTKENISKVVQQAKIQNGSGILEGIAFTGKGFQNDTTATTIIKKTGGIETRRDIDTEHKLKAWKGIIEKNVKIRDAKGNPLRFKTTLVKDKKTGKYIPKITPIRS